MSFISWQYAVLLCAVFVLYWRLPGRARIPLILAASYLFYGVWDARFLALLLTSTTVDYYCGRALMGDRSRLREVGALAALPLAWLAGYIMVTGRHDAIGNSIFGVAAAFAVIFTAVYQLLWRLPAARQRLAFLWLSVGGNLVILFFFKYFGFFADSLQALFTGLGWQTGWTLPNIILPVGISFYTFQSISYAVDIYRGQAQPVRDWPTFAAYLAFFPQLVAGPIERANDLVPQFLKPAGWSTDNFQRGLRLILVGLFKKVFVADNCALLANHAFDPHTPLNGYWALLGVLAFAFQIYGDFSGYTDIARGSARLIGFHLTWNFKFPYFARGPSDFWQRWHITLSSWFRDYVYIPLGGNRRGPARTLVNLWITMLFAGLWHGASWIFVLWGGYHALLLSLYILVPPLRNLAEGKDGLRWRVPLSIAVMFGFTLFGWVLFRCRDLATLYAWCAALGDWNPAAALPWIKPFGWLLLHTLPLLGLQALAWKARDEVEFDRLPWPATGLVYAVLFLAVFTATGGDVEFIYFQF